MTDPTSAETISAPDPLISAEEEQNPPDVASSSASAEGLQEQEVKVTADSNNASSSASQTGVVSPVVNRINNSTRRRWRKKQVTPSSGGSTSSVVNNHCFKIPVDAFQLFFNESIIENIHFERNLYCTQKGKVGNITKKEIQLLVKLKFTYVNYLCFNLVPVFYSYLN